MAFVKINNNLLVDERGVVMDKRRANVTHQMDKQTGRHYVSHTGEKVYIDELVVAHHGTPPNQGRNPRRGERIAYKDGDKNNLHIENLYITDKNAKGDPIKVDMDDVYARLAQMKIQGRSLEAMKAEARGMGVKLSESDILDLVGEPAEAEAKPLPTEPKEEEDIDAELKSMQEFLDEDEEDEEQTAFASKKDNGGGWYNLMVNGEEMLPKNKRESVIDKAVSRINSGEPLDKVLNTLR
jgi:hypothetical protein